MGNSSHGIINNGTVAKCLCCRHCEEPQAIASPVIARLTKSAEAISKTGSQQAVQSQKRDCFAPSWLAMTISHQTHNKAQVTVEAALVFVALIMLLYGILNVWLNFNQNLVERQPPYNATRVEAGSSNPGAWPVSSQIPLTEGESLGKDDDKVSNIWSDIDYSVVIARPAKQAEAIPK